MDALSLIRKPVEKELEQYRELFGSSLSSSNPILDVALKHVLRRKGKMMRPLLVLLAARCNGAVNEAVLHAAASLEMLHTASLVHDDVVDESDRRRGQQSVNALLDNKVAVLVGDYMLSTSLKHAALTGSRRVVELIARLGQTLSDGELLQLSNVDSTTISEEAYFEVVRKKTASLFAVCAQAGALLAGAAEERVEEARRYGECVGICFQLRDDIFDYFDSPELGKPTGNDMKEGKLTLPVIYAVSRPGAEAQRALALKVRAGGVSAEEIARLVDFTKQSGGIDYTRRVMSEYRDQAVEMLRLCPHPEVGEVLRHYVDFVIDRCV